jgi:hypothetical protein
MLNLVALNSAVVFVADVQASRALIQTDLHDAAVRLCTKFSTTRVYIATYEYVAAAECCYMHPGEGVTIAAYTINVVVVERHGGPRCFYKQA